MTTYRNPPSTEELLEMLEMPNKEKEASAARVKELEQKLHFVSSALEGRKVTYIDVSNMKPDEVFNMFFANKKTKQTETVAQNSLLDPSNFLVLPFNSTGKPSTKWARERDSEFESLVFYTLVAAAASLPFILAYIYYN